MTDPEKIEFASIHPARILGKALLLFLLFNVIYAVIHPSPGAFLLIHHGKYERFPALWIPDVRSDGSVAIERELFSNMDILFASHELTRQKEDDEYRVFIYGDSSVWGTMLYPDETVAGQLNQLNQHTCSGKRVVVYNLGYPSNSATKDLLFMQYAQRYQPDLNIWLFSMLAFQNIRQDVPFVVDNPMAVRELMEKYGLPHDVSALAPVRDSFWDATLIGRRQDLNLLVRLQASMLLLDSLGMDDPRIPVDGGIHVADVPKATDDFFGILPPADLREHLAFETLPVAHAITGGRIIYVGEPIEISGDDDAVAYNSAFPKWAYDQFREITATISLEAEWTYMDHWDLIPPEKFTNSVFHLGAEAETTLSGRLAEAILAATCP